MKKEHKYYVLCFLWILLCALEQITQNPFWGSLRECTVYIMYH